MRETIPPGFAWALLAAWGALARPCPAADVSRLWQQAAELERKGRRVEALEIYRRITSEDPSNLDAWNERAELEAASGDLTSARTSLEHALEARPDVAVLSRNLEKVRSRQARLAYDSAFGTTSDLPPLQLEAVSKREAAARKRELDSLRTALAGAQEEARRAARQRDSLQRREQESARARAAVQVAQAEPPAPPPAPAASPSSATGSGEVPPPPPAPPPLRVAEPPAPRVELPARPAKLDPLGTIEWWARAWSAQDVDAYLDCYAPDYHPVGGTRAEWMERRRERIATPRSIKVEVVSPKLVVSRPGHAEIVYRQVYQTESGKLTSRKRISLDLMGGRWLIVGESEAR